MDKIMAFPVINEPGFLGPRSEHFMQICIYPVVRYRPEGDGRALSLVCPSESGGSPPSRPACFHELLNNT